MAKKLPETVLIQCTKCELIVRTDENDNEVLEEETFCHRVLKGDLAYRLKECKRKR